jgi:hypothetical protein
MKPVIPIIVMFAASTAFANAWQDSQHINNAVRAFLSGEADALVAVDPRLRMPRCGSQLQAGWLTEKQNSVVVSCIAPVPWRVSLPVQRRRGSQPALSAYPATTPPEVRAGDRLIIRHETEAFQLDMEAVALSSARLGERIRIRTAQGGAALQAEVTGKGAAKLLAKEE